MGAGLLLAGGLMWFADSHGGPVTLPKIPPTRDYFTPASQNGYTLLAVQRPEDEIGNFHFTPPAEGRHWPPEERYGFGDDHAVAGLWIRLPGGSGNPTSYQVTGHASSGQDFPLKASYPSGGGRGDLLFTSLPGCYDERLRYVDVTVSDRQSHAARWRISRLPVMRHVISPPVRTGDTFNAPGVTLTLRATRRLGKHGEYVRCQLFPSIAPASHQWQLWMRGDSPETDWMPCDAETAETTSMIFTDADARQVIAFNHGAAIDEFVQHPYVRQDQYVRIQGHLKQFETYDEKVTFHNIQIEKEDPGDVFRVLQRQSVTTPSGICVTLPVQNEVNLMKKGGFDTAGLLVELQPHAQENYLPNSPLVKEYDRPVEITIQPAKPDGSLSEDMGPGLTRQVTLVVPDAELTTESQGRDLSLVVRQRVDLQTLPVTLTAPITDDTATQKS